jgi:hypothetical protein
MQTCVSTPSARSDLSKSSAISASAFNLETQEAGISGPLDTPRWRKISARLCSPHVLA